MNDLHDMEGAAGKMSIKKRQNPMPNHFALTVILHKITGFNGKNMMRIVRSHTSGVGRFLIITHQANQTSV